MHKKYPNPAQVQVIAWMRNAIDQSVLKPGMPLPSIRTLALQAGVSYVTMWKSLSVLKAHGLVKQETGKHRLVISGPAQAPTLAADILPPTNQTIKTQQFAWQRVKESIINDFLLGELRSDRKLPTKKELMVRYGVSFRTLKKSLQSLADSGYLKRRSASLRGIQQGNARIVVLWWWPYATSDLYYETWRCIEQECSVAGIGFEILGFTYRNNKISYVNLQTELECRLPDSPEVLGYVLAVIGPENVGGTPLLRELQHHKKPVAVLDFIGGWDFPRFRGNEKRIRIFSLLSSIQGARTILKHFVQLGHRHVAFLSPYHEARWSNLRLDALHACIDTELIPVELHSFTCQNVKQEIPSPNASIIARSNKTLNQWLALTGMHPSGPLAKHIEASTRAYLWFDSTLENFTPLMEQALCDKRITAWICSNDTTAYLAYAFLQKKGLRIPGDISIMGYDNTRLLLVNGITSHDFNLSSVAHAMVSFVMHPDLFNGPKYPRSTALEGMLVMRESIGPRGSAKSRRL